MSPEIEAALRAAHEVATALQARMNALREAVQRGDVDRVIKCARAVVGLDDEEADGEAEGYRAAACLDGDPS
jgi:hypothetical protein